MLRLVRSSSRVLFIALGITFGSLLVKLAINSLASDVSGYRQIKLIHLDALRPLSININALQPILKVILIGHKHDGIVTSI